MFSEHRPDKSHQFPGHRGRCLTGELTTTNQMPVASPQAMPGTVGDIDHPLRLMGPAVSQGFTDMIGMPVMPRDFHKQTSDPFVPRLANRPFRLFVPAGGFRRGQPQITHQRPRVCKTSKLKNLGDQRDRREGIDTMETAQKTHDLLVRGTRGKLSHSLIQRRQTLHTVLHLCKVAVKDLTQQRRFKFQSP